MTDFAPTIMLLLCFLAFVVASFRHFDPAAHSSGNLLVRGLTLAGTVLNLWLAWLAMPLTNAELGVAFAFGIVSLVIFVAALRASAAGELHVAFTGSGPERLITSGIYGRIRNPLYTSYLVFWAGWMPSTAWHPASVACFALFLVLYWLAVRQEEAFLTRQFGDQFVAFKSSTGRFLPRFVFFAST